MMVGDAELPVIQLNVQLQNNRILNSLNHLKTNETLLLRRQAAEVFSSTVAFASDFDGDLQMKIVKGIYKIMKKYDEDWIVLSQILTLLKNLVEKRSALIHLLLPLNITKLLAYHARYSSFHEIRDLSVQILGDFAATCCFECQKSVAKTTASVTILEVLEKKLDTLTLNQQVIYSRALTNIFCETFANSETIDISVGSKGQMIDVIKKLITLPSPNEAIFNGLTLLHMSTGRKDKCDTITNDNVLMTRLLQIFDNDEDIDDTAYVIRIVGELALSHDSNVKKIFDYGFVDIIEAKLTNANGTPYEQRMLWCLSNILGMREFPIAYEIIKREELWEKLVQHCYSYDTLIRRDAIFCVLNVASFFKGNAKDEIYREFFGRLLIDILEGFTIESDLSMIRVLGAVLAHIKGDIKQHCHQYRDLIVENQLDKAVENRILWIQNGFKTFDLTENGRKEMYELFNLCYNTMFLIQEFKRLHISSSVPAKTESSSMNLNSSTTFNGSLNTLAHVGTFSNNQPLPMPPAVRFYPVIFPATIESPSMDWTAGSSTFNGQLMAQNGIFDNNPLNHG